MIELTDFYQDWTDKRLSKIIDIFGKDWFLGKEVLELGAHHGKMGIELMKLGANVYFADVREDNLEIIKQSLPMEVNTISLDQNENYDINDQFGNVKKFDLILHMSILCHLENWKNDLSRIMNHTGVMLLETMVNPSKGGEDEFFDVPKNDYGVYTGRSSKFTQESVEKVMTDLGYKYFRFDTDDLDTNWTWNIRRKLIKNIYSWNYDKIQRGVYEDHFQNNNVVGMPQFRRMWLVLK